MVVGCKLNKEVKQMKRYAMYLRKSRADQDETITETLRRHKETLIEYAIKNDLNIAQQDIYEEVVSGESLYARPQMLKLLEQVSNGAYIGVLCMDIDRLGRGGMSDQGIILESFKHSNTQILTPSKIYDLSDENDENNLEFKAFFARFEYKQIRKRMLAGTERAVREGAYLIPAPFGYRNTTINKKPSLEIYEPEAKFVRMIFDMYANQGMGCSQITYAINATGIKTRRDDTFNKVGILRILKNPVYIGKVRWHKNKAPEKQIITDGLHQPIIDIETWNKTQEVLNVRYKPPCVNRGMKNSLAGLIYCKNCGGLMKRLPPNKARKTPISRINCEKKGCITGTRFDYLENAVIKYLREKLDNLDYEYSTKNAPKENHSEQINILNSSLKRLKNKPTNYTTF